MFYILASEKSPVGYLSNPDIVSLNLRRKKFRLNKTIIQIFLLKSMLIIIIKLFNTFIYNLLTMPFKKQGIPLAKYYNRLGQPIRCANKLWPMSTMISLEEIWPNQQYTLFLSLKFSLFKRFHFRCYFFLLLPPHLNLPFNIVCCVV